MFTSKIKNIPLLFFMYILLACRASHGFAPTTGTGRTSPAFARSNHPRRQAVHRMMVTDFPSFLLSNAMSAAVNADTEVQVLQDVTHVLLDFPDLRLPWTPTNASPTKVHGTAIASLVGRLLVLASDYLPDHAIRFDELAFQLLLLGMTIRQLLSIVMTTNE